MGNKLFFTQTDHEPQVWGTLDCDWAEQMRKACFGSGRQEHALAEDPESADIIVFWEPHQDSQVIWAPRLRSHPLVLEYPYKVFVVSVEDSPLGFLPGLYCGLEKRLYDPRRHRTCFYHRTPNPYVYSRRTRVSEREPTLLASFIGAPSYPMREWFFTNRDSLKKQRIEVRETVRGRYSTDPTDPALEAERLNYIGAILDSKFSLCLRGNGVATFRLQESLALGRAPVIVSDDWVPVEGPDWQRFAVFVKESELESLPEILREYEPHWREMGDEASEAYDVFVGDGNHARHTVDQIVEIYRNRKHDELEIISRWDALIEAEQHRRRAAELIFG